MERAVDLPGDERSATPSLARCAAAAANRESALLHDGHVDPVNRTSTRSSVPEGCAKDHDISGNGSISDACPLVYRCRRSASTTLIECIGGLHALRHGPPHPELAMLGLTRSGSTLLDAGSDSWCSPRLGLAPSSDSFASCRRR